jgi:hypothetical protein
VAEDGKELREVVEDSFFEVALAPGSNVLFDLGTSCNVGQPSYAFPLEA